MQAGDGPAGELGGAPKRKRKRGRRLKLQVCVRNCPGCAHGLTEVLCAQPSVPLHIAPPFQHVGALMAALRTRLAEFVHAQARYLFLRARLVRRPPGATRAAESGNSGAAAAGGAEAGVVGVGQAGAGAAAVVDIARPLGEGEQAAFDATSDATAVVRGDPAPRDDERPAADATREPSRAAADPREEDGIATEAKDGRAAARSPRAPGVDPPSCFTFCGECSVVLAREDDMEAYEARVSAVRAELEAAVGMVFRCVPDTSDSQDVGGGADGDGA